MDSPFFCMLQEAIEHPGRSKDWFGIAEHVIDTNYALRNRASVSQRQIAVSSCVSFISNCAETFHSRNVRTLSFPNLPGLFTDLAYSTRHRVESAFLVYSLHTHKICGLLQSLHLTPFHCAFYSTLYPPLSLLIVIQCTTNPPSLPIVLFTSLDTMHTISSVHLRTQPHLSLISTTHLL
jgi:hypothetical protein